MTETLIPTTCSVKISIGPEIEEAGSWNWVGKDLMEFLSESQIYQANSFQNELPQSDVFIFVKWLPERDTLKALAKRSLVIYCPIDVYGGGAEIDADWERLRCCDRVIVHSPGLEKYFRGYAKTTYLDHHMKFTIPPRETYKNKGPILWTGVWLNLLPVVEWVNQHGLPDDLIILTNFDGHSYRTPADFGFQSSKHVQIEEWSEERHREVLPFARAAIDIKGNDFRQRYKPPAKALDLITSGIPLAMNSDSSAVRYLRNFGFRIPSPEETEYWLSQEYWEKTQAIGKSLSHELSHSQIMNRWLTIISEVISERGDR